MDLAEFQLNMDMLRSISSSQQHQQQQQQQQQTNGVFENMDIFFNDNNNNQNMQYMNSTYANISTTSASATSTPAFHTKNQNDYFGDDDILTPLISPAITPSFTYQQKHHHHNAGNDIDFSPLSSPAMLPQRDNSHSHHQHHHQLQHHQHSSYHQQQQHQQDSIHSANTNYNQLTRNQICEQYEQLEQAKLLITRRLTEMQKQQHQLTSNRTSPSSHLDNMNENQQMINHSKDVYQNNSHIEPVTPASLMNLRQRQSNKTAKKISFAPVTAKAALNELDISDNIDTIAQSNSVSLPPSSSSSSSTTSVDNSLSTSTSSLTIQGKQKRKQSTDNKTPRKARRTSGHDNKSNSLSSSNNSYHHHHHASPRALKPLLISPSLTPDNPHHLLPSSPFHPPTTSANISGTIQSSSSSSLVTSVKDAEHILATKSNYQNLMEGKAAALGIAFSPQIKSGLEVRRTAHKAAEQKRRDSLKEWFDRLRREVEEGYVKKKSGITSKVIKEQQREKNDNTSPPSSSSSNNNNNNSSNSSDEQHSPSLSSSQQQQQQNNDNNQDESMEDQPALKPLSKVLLLRYAYEYITHLKQNLNERDEYIRKLTNGSDPTNQEEEERDENGENGDNGDDDNDINMEQSSNN